MNMQKQSSAIRMIVNLGTNPTVKSTAGGKRIARFSVAAVEPDAETGQNKVKWYSVVSWGSLADLAQRHLYKGKRVLLCGYLVIKTSKDKKGNTRSRQEIVASDLILLNSGRTPAAQSAA